MNRHPVAVTSVTGMHASSASEPYSASQWEFQDPKMEVPTIYKAYFLGLCKWISPQNMAKNMVQYLHFRILKLPLIIRYLSSWSSWQPVMMLLILQCCACFGSLRLWSPCECSLAFEESLGGATLAWQKYNEQLYQLVSCYIYIYIYILCIHILYI